MAIFDSHDRYINPEPLGKGGMGMVFKVWDTRLQRFVAAKVLNAVAIDQHDIDRFKREATSMAQLQHPNICRIHDFDFVNYHPFLVMDLIEGRSLDKLIAADWPFPTKRIAKWVYQVAQALGHAHAKGIYHRDLKPQNIMIEQDGNAILMDFGLAKDAQATESLTASGGFMGTPAYAPPEQFQDTKRVDHRADIYSLGIVLYELLCRRPPFVGSFHSILVEIIQATMMRPPSEFSPQVDAKLESICLKAAALNPVDRHQTMKDFANDLKAFATSSERQVKPYPSAVVPRRTQAPIPADPQVRTQQTPPLALAPFDAQTARRHQEAWAAYLGRSVISENSIGMKLVVIPPGQFEMGEGAGQVPVTITQPFLLGQMQVTQQEWEKLMPKSPWKGQDDVKLYPNHAASYISWKDAVAFCQKLTSRDRTAGKISSEWEYSLPTEAQWEYASRAGTITQFSFGDEEAKLKEYSWYDENADKQGEHYPHEVGRKLPNAFELYDMHGNVWEWCWDRYDASLQGGTNPTGPKTATSYRVYRGGSWISPDSHCRSAYRSYGNPIIQSLNYGFRVAIVQAR